MRAHLRLFLAAVSIAAAPASAQSMDDRPWQLKISILVIDPYEHNSVNWQKVRTDPQVKAMIHRAYQGLRADKKYAARIKEAKAAGLLTGIYLLGLPGDPIKQADALIEAGQRNGVTLLTLDIDDVNPKKFMTLPDAVRFIEHVHRKTGRYPLFYTNFSTFKHISQRYGRDSVLAKAPLWLARFGPKPGMNSTAVWPTYTLWQFQSEINCKAAEQCYHRVPGTRSDMDVNVFRGTQRELKALFGQ